MDGKELTALYDKDTFRCHRYLILEGDGIKGTIYIDKDADVPKKVTIALQTKEA